MDNSIEDIHVFIYKSLMVLTNINRYLQNFMDIYKTLWIYMYLQTLWIYLQNFMDFSVNFKLTEQSVDLSHLKL